MLAIRMQRTGRKGHAMFRVVVQESRYTPTSGKVVAALGSYDPHAKTVVLDKEKATFYLTNGAQPSPRVVRLLKAEGVKLPSWVSLPADQKRETRNPEKRRSTAPKKAAVPAEEPAEAAAETPVETETTEPTEAAPAETEATAEASTEAASPEVESAPTEAEAAEETPNA
jgi:small subunit ribosomal protein S16